jgi:hypothetical protein
MSQKLLTEVLLASARDPEPVGGLGEGKASPDEVQKPPFHLRKAGGSLIERHSKRAGSSGESSFRGVCLDPEHPLPEGVSEGEPPVAKDEVPDDGADPRPRDPCGRPDTKQPHPDILRQVVQILLQETVSSAFLADEVREGFALIVGSPAGIAGEERRTMDLPAGHYDPPSRQFG